MRETRDWRLTAEVLLTISRGPAVPEQAAMGCHQAGCFMAEIGQLRCGFKSDPQGAQRA
jgi:hypothetical protein